MASKKATCQNNGHQIKPEWKHQLVLKPENTGLLFYSQPCQTFAQEKYILKLNSAYNTKATAMLQSTNSLQNSQIQIGDKKMLKNQLHQVQR